MPRPRPRPWPPAATSLKTPEAPAGTATADGHPQHHRAVEVPVRPPADRGRLGLDLLHGRPDVVEELHLRARPQTPQRLPHRPPDDVGLGQRRVVAASDAEALLQTMGGAEDAALALDLADEVLGRVGHVLAEHADALVGLHLLV